MKCNKEAIGIKKIGKFAKYSHKLKNYQPLKLPDSQFMKLMVGVFYNSFMND